MFRRISGSSSMTNIFFIIHFKNRQIDEHGCALAHFAVYLHRPAVQFGAAFHQQEAKPGTRTGPDISAAVKSLKQLRLIRLGNANSLITNDAYSVMSVPFHREMHG